MLNMSMELLEFVILRRKAMTVGCRDGAFLNKPRRKILIRDRLEAKYCFPTDIRDRSDEKVVRCRYEVYLAFLRTFPTPSL